jgi:hypothetical protein
VSGRGHEVALWAGAAAFFSSLLAIGAFDLLDVNGRAELLGSIIVAAITGGAVYSKERLNSAKGRGSDGDPPPTQ